MSLFLFWLWQVVVIESMTRVSASSRFNLGSKLVGDLINAVEDSLGRRRDVAALIFLKKSLSINVGCCSHSELSGRVAMWGKYRTKSTYLFLPARVHAGTRPNLNGLVANCLCLCLCAACTTSSSSSSGSIPIRLLLLANSFTLPSHSRTS